MLGTEAGRLKGQEEPPPQATRHTGMHLPPAAGRVTVTTVAPEPWPLRHLELRTPRLSLRPLVRGTLQHHWSVRAALGPDDWTITFLVRQEGEVVGTQGLSGKDYGTTREVSTGSWLGRGHQGRGIGSEMRAAVLLLAFDHLGAGSARSGAFTDNAASLAVSRKLGYRADGTHAVASRGQRAVETRLLLTPETFVRTQWTLRVDGLDGCRALLGA